MSGPHRPAGRGDPTPVLLSVQTLTVLLSAGGGEVRAVDEISFDLGPGETLGLVGESGSGKTITALSIIRLLPPALRIGAGRITFEGLDLLSLPDAAMRAIRGSRIGFVFQEPMTALTPVLTIGDQIAETLQVHGLASRREALRRAVALLDDVAMPDPERQARMFPHQLSGGMRQRAMIALAIACCPVLVIADEPTAALDVTVQAQILDLLTSLRHRHRLALLLITHDLGVVAHAADRVAVMYAGRIVEHARAVDLFAWPEHPYTQGLLASIPRGRQGGRLKAIPGVVARPGAAPPGCAFAPRCERRIDGCDRVVPEPIVVAPDHVVRCHLVERGRPA